MKALAPAGADPFRPGFLADPWDEYRQMRSAGPVVWHDRLNLWFVTGYAEAVSVLRDDDYRVPEPGEAIGRLAARAGASFPHLVAALEVLPLFRNPPAHALTRRTVAAALGGRPMSTYAPDMRRIAEGLLERPRGDGGFDAAQDFAERMPPLFMAQLLGIPAADLPGLQETTLVLRAMNRLVRLGEYQRLDRAAAAGLAYFSEIVARRRKSPGDDGISRMIAAEHHGERLAGDEIVSLCLALFLVGVETTVALIGSAIRTLVDFPGLGAELRSEPVLLRPAVDELLRFESPVQNVNRRAGAARCLAGQSIEPGSEVVVLLASANRDEAAWSDAGRLDFRREGVPHLAFGDGHHACLGATLARMEAHAALGAWLRGPACRRVRGDDRWQDFDWLRRLREFPVEFC